MKQSERMIRLKTRIFIITIALVLLSTIIGSYRTFKRFEESLIPEINLKIENIGRSINSLMLKSLNYGIPFDQFNGMKAYFASVQKDNPEISYFLVTDNDNTVLYHFGDDIRSLHQQIFANHAGAEAGESSSAGPYYNNALAIQSDGKVFGTLHLGIEKRLVQDKIKEILYDIITVVAFALLITFELLLFLLTFTVSAPIVSIQETFDRMIKGDFSRYLDIHSQDEVGRFVLMINKMIYAINDKYYELKWNILEYKDTLKKSFSTRLLDNRVEKLESDITFGNLDQKDKFFINLLIYIRPALFLFIFAESLSLSFFPMFVEELYQPVPGISKELIIGLPISIFMLFWGLSLPSAGVWSDRVGRRKPFLIGAVLTGVGLALTAVVTNLYLLLALRSMTAVGYGMVFITCQGYVTDNTSAKNRTKGMAMFLSGFFSGSLCGSAIGGIIAERIGYRSTFMISAFIVALSAAFVFAFLKDRQKKDEPVKKSIKLSDFKLLLANKRFLTVTFLSAVPSKICLTGFLYYTGPLYLKLLGNNQSNIGRVLMVYGLIMVIFSPMVGKVVDAFHSRRVFVGYGGLLAALGLLVIIPFDNTVGLLVCVFLLGLGHSISVSSQLTLVTEVCKKEEQEIGLGSVIGIFRLLERIGNIAGPLIAGALISIFNFRFAIAGIGGISLVSVLLFIFFFTVFSQVDRRSETTTGASG